MPSVKNMLAAAAGAGGAGLNVEEVFSTYLYTGNNTTNNIVNGIDFSTEGGMLWIKNRNDGGGPHTVYDTNRGNNSGLRTNASDDAETGTNNTQDLTAFNSNGFSLGTGYAENVNYNNQEYCSWSFRKASNFFDVVTYTGNGTAGRTISHNLGTTVGSVWVKKTSSSAFWMVYHRGIHSSNPEYYHLALNATFSTGDLGQSQSNPSNMWNQTAPTSTQITLGSDSNVNENGATYVAYVFAHNNNDGGFGPDADQDIIKCGEYTGDGGAGTTEINLGFEPQWILVKAHSAADNWFLIDNIRGWATHNNLANDAYLIPNTANSESNGGFLDITSTGFKTTLYTNVNVSSRKYIYIAIRRGPMAVPTSASDVFSIDTSAGTSPTPPAYVANHLVDFAFFKTVNATGNWQSSSRLTQGRTIQINNSNSEADSSVYKFDFMNGWVDNSFSDNARYAWMWKRAPNYFDVVAYTGTGNAGLQVPHNLGVVPEMMWIKRRDGSAEWAVYHKDLDVNNDNAPETDYIILNENYAGFDRNFTWNDTAPTATHFTLGIGGETANNQSGQIGIAYLFASLDGISKVGSFSHTNGSTTNVDCGFSNGSKLVIIKSQDVSGHWYLFDSVRGIVSGNEYYVRMNLSNNNVDADFIDPYSSGFAIYNAPTANYIFYAIAA